MQYAIPQPLAVQLRHLQLDSAAIAARKHAPNTPAPQTKRHTEQVYQAIAAGARSQADVRKATGLEHHVVRNAFTSLSRGGRIVPTGKCSIGMVRFYLYKVAE